MTNPTRPRQPSSRSAPTKAAARKTASRKSSAPARSRSRSVAAKDSAAAAQPATAPILASASTPASAPPATTPPRRAASRRRTSAASTAEGAEGASAAEKAPRYQHFYCNVRPTLPREMAPGMPEERTRAINTLSDKWVNGTALSYYFFDQPGDGETVTLADGSRQFVPWTGTEAAKAAVRAGFQAWADLGLGLRFTEVASREQATIRIGFMSGDGAWSYVGRAVLGIATDQRTMNFGWPIANDPDTVIHEIGHTLGFQHEHQNPFSGLVWNEEKVYASLAAPPNSWSREKTFFNIIRKLPENTVEGTTWDPDSVMHYPFEAGLILEPPRFRTQPLQPAGGLSAHDITQVRTLYPPQEPADRFPRLKLAESMRLRIGAGEQVDVLIQPERSRSYRVGTFGEADTVIVLFEQVEGELKYRGGDDDSGSDRNALLKLRLQRGKTYVLRLRLYWAAYAGETAVMWW